MGMQSTWTRRTLLVSASVGASAALIGSSRAQTTKSAIRIVNTSGNSTFILQDLLKTQGILDQFGLDAEHINVADGAKATEALLKGDADVCMQAGFGPVLAEIESGAKLKVLSGGSMLSPQAVYSKRDDIRELKDLVGKTVGTGAMGAALHQKMVAMLRKRGIDPASVSFKNVGSTANVFKAVVAGDIDAGPADLDVYADQDKYGVHSLRDGNMWTELAEYTNQASYTTDAAIAAKRDILIRAIAAYGKMYRFLQSPQSRDAWMQTSTRLYKTPADWVDPQWKFYQDAKPYPPGLAITADRVKYIQELNVSMNLQKRVLPFEEVSNVELAGEALKMLG